MSEPLNLKTLSAYLDSYSPPVDVAPPGYGVIKLETVRDLLRALREARTALQSIATACEMCGAFGYPTYSDMEARARTALEGVRDD